MRKVILQRYYSSDSGTLGKVLVDGVNFCWSMEPPDRDNRPNISCIPPGAYPCVWHQSPKYGWVYLVTGVTGRGYILIHPGNLGGDRAKGLKTHTWGCLLLGRRLGYLSGPRAVLVSRPCVSAFNQLMKHEDFMLIVQGV